MNALEFSVNFGGQTMGWLGPGDCAWVGNFSFDDSLSATELTYTVSASPVSSIGHSSLQRHDESVAGYWNTEG